MNKQVYPDYLPQQAIFSSYVAALFFMCRPLFCFAFFLVCLALPRSGKAQPDTVLIGVYAMDIYDIKMNENSFSTQFWVWFNYRNKELAPLAVWRYRTKKNQNPVASF